MEEKVIAFIAGIVTGGGVVAAIGYFGIYRKYIPLNRIQDEVNGLEEDRRSKARQLDAMDKAFVDRKKEYDDHIIELQTQLDVYEGDVEEARMEHEDRATVRPSASAGTPYSAIRQDKDDVKGTYEIKTGNPRWDGPLTADEQAELDACEGDENLIAGELLRIKEARYELTGDPDNESYLISGDEHDEMPEFFDEESLDYYEKDDILARGTELISTVEDLINPVVLNHFGKLSGSGDPHLVWCRNERLKTDFSITWHEGSWQSEVFDLDEDTVAPAKHKYVMEKAKRLERDHAKS